MWAAYRDGPSGHIVRGLDGAAEDLLYRHIFLDCARMAQIVMEMPDVDETRVGATGGSQGGALTLACVALEPRVKRAAPIYPFLSDYKRVCEMDMDKDAYAELQREWFRKFDPRHEREEEVFTRLGYVDIQFLAPRIKAEVLMGVGLRIKSARPPASMPPSTRSHRPRKPSIIQISVTRSYRTSTTASLSG